MITIIKNYKQTVVNHCFIYLKCIFMHILKALKFDKQGKSRYRKRFFPHYYLLCLNADRSLIRTC